MIPCRVRVKGSTNDVDGLYELEFPEEETEWGLTYRKRDSDQTLLLYGENLPILGGTGFIGWLIIKSGKSIAKCTRKFDGREEISRFSWVTEDGDPAEISVDPEITHSVRLRQGLNDQGRFSVLVELVSPSDSDFWFRIIAKEKTGAKSVSGLKCIKPGTRNFEIIFSSACSVSAVAELTLWTGSCLEHATNGF